MLIKITKSMRPNFWYKPSIGGIFEVQSVHELGVSVHHGEREVDSVSHGDYEFVDSLGLTDMDKKWLDRVGVKYE